MRCAAHTVVTISCVLFLFAEPGFAQPTIKSQPSQSPAATARPSPQPSADQIDENDVIKVTTNLVTSNALVVGRNRKYVPSLKPEDFHIFEDGVEQEIAYFAPVDRPFNVALIIDNSRSTAFELRDIKEAAIAFVQAMRAEDRASILTASEEFTTPVAPTVNHQDLIQSISKIQPAGATRIYDAVDFAINHLLKGVEGRKAIVLLTDGVDNDSRDASYQTSLDDAANSDVQVYAIQFSTSEVAFKRASRLRHPAPVGSGFNPVDYQRADAYLHQLTEVTGTSLFPAAVLADLDAAVTKITEELHNEYTLGFYPRIAGRRGEVRRLEVRVNQPFLNVRARTAYSFGPVAVTNTEQKSVAAAPLTEMESRSPFRTARTPERPLDARWVCKGPFVPGDFALVQEGFDAKCPPSKRANDTTNAWYIRRPAAREVVCKGYLSRNGSDVEISPIPNGYAVVGEVESPVCSPSNNPERPSNAWSVKRPSSEDTVCKGFLIPRGFVVVMKSIARFARQALGKQTHGLL